MRPCDDKRSDPNGGGKHMSNTYKLCFFQDVARVICIHEHTQTLAPNRATGKSPEVIEA